MNYFKLLCSTAVLISSTLFTQAVAAEAPKLSPGKLNLVAGDYSVEFSEDGCWTMNWLKYKGLALLETSGANQTVIKVKPKDGVPEKNEWIGTKHGGEIIESLALEVDGKVYPFEEPLQAPAGTSYKFIKVARYGPVRGHWTVVVDASGVTQTTKFEQVEDISPIAYAYAFMHCWNPSMTDWRAILKNGSMVGEKFPQERTQSLKEDITALAVYSETEGVGAVVTYPKAYAGVANRKNFLNYWPKRHNKHYLCVTPANLVRETYTCTIRAFQAPGEGWVEKARELIDGATVTAK